MDQRWPEHSSGRYRGTRLALRSVLTGALLASMSGCSLVLDFSEPPDAAPVVSAPDAFLPSRELCMAFESNNDQTTATELVNPTVEAALCSPADLDFYRFSVPAPGADVAIDLRFMSRVGNLGLSLYQLDMPDVIATSDSPTEDLERIERSGQNQLASGDYVIEVFSAVSSVNTYALSLDIVPAAALY